MYTQEKGSVCRYGSGIEKDGASVSMSEVIKTLNEIETLRSEKEHLLTVCELRRLETESLQSDYENVCHDIALQNKQLGEWYADKCKAEKDGDEWKRRAFDLYTAAIYPSVDIPINAAEWFEEKDDE